MRSRIGFILTVMAVSCMVAEGVVTNLPAAFGAKAVTVSREVLRTSDRLFKFTAIPDQFLGACIVTIIRGALDKPAPSYTIILTTNAAVYLLVHDRGTPTIPVEWERTQLKVSWTTDGKQQFNDIVYKRECTPGELIIPGHTGRDGTYGIPNACIIAVAQ